jgi:hypothetical protein
VDYHELAREIEGLHAELTARAAASHTEESFGLAARLLDLVQKYQGYGMLEYTEDLHRAADRHYDRGEYGRAETLYGWAIDLFVALFGAAPRADHARQLHRAACAAALNLDLDLGDPYVDVKSQGVIALAAGLAHGEGPSYFAVSQFHLACVYAATGRLDAALAMMRAALDSDDFMIRQICAIGSEEQRTAFLRRVQKNGYLFLSLVLHHFVGDAAAVGDALALVFRRKSLSAEVHVAQRAFVVGGLDATAVELARAVDELRRGIARKTLAGPDEPESLSQHLRQLDAWREELTAAESRLARAVAAGGGRLEDLYATPSPEQVRRSLPPDAALVELVRLPLFDFRAVPASGQPSWYEPSYLAFVLPPGATRPRLFDLGPARALETDLALLLKEAHGAGQSRDLCRAQANPSQTTDRHPSAAEASGVRRAAGAPPTSLRRKSLAADVLIRSRNSTAARPVAYPARGVPAAPSR